MMMRCSGAVLTVVLCVVLPAEDRPAWRADAGLSYERFSGERGVEPSAYLAVGHRIAPALTLAGGWTGTDRVDRFGQRVHGAVYTDVIPRTVLDAEIGYSTGSPYAAHQDLRMGAEWYAPKWVVARARVGRRWWTGAPSNEAAARIYVQPAAPFALSFERSITRVEGKNLQTSIYGLHFSPDEPIGLSLGLAYGDEGIPPNRVDAGWVGTTTFHWNPAAHWGIRIDAATEERDSGRERRQLSGGIIYRW